MWDSASLSEADFREVLQKVEDAAQVHDWREQEVLGMFAWAVPSDQHFTQEDLVKAFQLWNINSTKIKDLLAPEVTSGAFLMSVDTDSNQVCYKMHRRVRENLNKTARKALIAIEGPSQSTKATRFVGPPQALSLESATNNKRPLTREEEELIAALGPKGWSLGERLGGGGQGSVYKVQHSDGKSGAVKTLNTPTKRESALGRFYREIQAQRTVDHPAIVKVFGHSDPIDRVHFYVMEYHEQVVPLKDIAFGDKSPYYKNPLAALELYQQLLGALSACEAANIVHRDLSLGNILIRKDGRILLIDFGCCHVFDGADLTVAGESIGTKHYMAPECDGHSNEEPTFQADLYSAGKILWTLVTQRRVHRERAVFRDTMLLQLLPDCPMAWHLWHIFEKTIRENPADRYDTVAEAMKSANHVGRLIRMQYPPLDALHDSLCPTCGVGTLKSVEYLINKNAEVAAIVKVWDGYKKFQVCPVCGHSHLIVESFLAGHIQKRRDLS